MFDTRDAIEDIRQQIFGIGDPIRRLEALNQVRLQLAELLTGEYERACFDARKTGRFYAAAELLSERAVRDYSARWNGRSVAAKRVRWADPLNPHGIQQAVDLTKIRKFKPTR
jgi:hypothetical protein